MKQNLSLLKDYQDNHNLGQKLSKQNSLMFHLMRNLLYLMIIIIKDKADKDKQVLIHQDQQSHRRFKNIKSQQGLEGMFLPKTIDILPKIQIPNLIKTMQLNIRESINI